ncbi:hypothetical protein MACK_000309 [Theileria orientalis]|uniref:AMP-activated protein kinase glycogen-binding domain-containing protein n=1 Tax=Theileria orientalis TaxID=68886 RepID=A0A976M9F1_THEOR|nr:hypothetical protein MACK_000309 [Theileria orientalis]
MDEFRKGFGSCPEIRISAPGDDIENDSLTEELEKKLGLKPSNTSFDLELTQKEREEPTVAYYPELYDSNASDCDSQDHVTVVFNWNHGGDEVYLVEHNEKEQRRIRMIKSKNCFSTIQELPKKLFKYRFLVDNVLQYSPEDPCVKTEDGFVNYIDIGKFKPTDYSMPRQRQELNIGTYGHELPGPNYSTMEPPIYPDILNYRSPDFDNFNRVASEVHILSNHVYEDTQARSFLGPSYKSYMCLHRLPNELSNVQFQPRSVSFIYVTPNEHNPDNGSKRI